MGRWIAWGAMVWCSPVWGQAPATDLLQRGEAAMAREAYGVAHALWQEGIQRFDRGVFHYNEALTFALEGRCAEAIAGFGRYQRRFPSGRYAAASARVMRALRACPLPVTLRVTPAGDSEVRVGDHPPRLLRGDQMELRLPQGTHVVVVARPGCQTAETELTVPPAAEPHTLRLDCAPVAEAPPTPWAWAALATGAAGLAVGAWGTWRSADATATANDPATRGAAWDAAVDERSQGRVWAAAGYGAGGVALAVGLGLLLLDDAPPVAVLGGARPGLMVAF